MSRRETGTIRTRRASTRRRAFTLLEVIVVVTIIALLATLVAPRLLSNIGRSKARVAQSEVASIAQQVKLYCLDQGLSKPGSDFDLEELLAGDDPYFESADDLIDPWDNPYVIIVPGEKNKDFDIMSYGGDGQAGGDGEDADIIH